MDSERSFPVEPGVTLYYRLWRKDQPRPLLILLHGMASNLTRWSEFVENTILKDHFDILRVDLRGHGRSFTRSKIGMEIWTSDLATLMDSLGYERAAFVGHSLGANVALWFATHYPQRVSGIVLIDPVMTEALRGWSLWIRRFSPLLCVVVAFIRLLNRLGWRRKEIPHRDLRELDQHVRQHLLGAGKEQEFVQRYTSPIRDIEHFPTAHYLQEAIEFTRPIPNAAPLHMPILALISQAVTFTDTAATRKALTRFPQTETIQLTAYHWPLTEKPTEVREIIEKWCLQFLARTT